MRIGFDAKRAYFNKTGLGNYSRGIIDGLMNLFPQYQYTLFSPKNPDKSQLYNTAAPTVFPAESKKSALWRSWGIYKDLNQNQLDIFHGLSNELPFSSHKINAKKVVTIHDLIFLRFPELYPAIDRWIYNIKFRYAVKNADTIIAISEQTKRDIISYYNADPKKIAIVYQSAAKNFTPISDQNILDTVKDKYNIPEQYLLNVGTVETRKNVGLVIEALVGLPQNIKLVIVGKHQKYIAHLQTLIEKHQLKDRVLFLTNVSYNDLPAIYQLAHIFVYPSRFEGFGIPIIEALQMQIPVIAATGSCLEEAGGPDSIYVNPDDVQAMTTAIEMLWDNEEQRNKMITKGLAYVQQFQPEVIAKAIENTYKNTL